MPRTDPKAQRKVAQVMHEFKAGELRSGSGRKVTNPKQAIAIGLSEAREAGAKVPPKQAARKARPAAGKAQRKTPRKAPRKAPREASGR